MHILEGEVRYPQEREFSRNIINFHAFLYNRRNWKNLCVHPGLGVAPVASEFHTNLWDRIGSTVYVRGAWVPLNSMTINTYFEIEDGVSK